MGSPKWIRDLQRHSKASGSGEKGDSIPLLRLSLLQPGRPEWSSTSAQPSDLPGPDPWTSSILALPWGILQGPTQALFPPGGNRKRLSPGLGSTKGETIKTEGPKGEVVLAAE